MLDVIFVATLIAEVLLGGCVVVSLVRPTLRIWPPPGRDSWQYRLVWTLTGLCAVGLAAVGVLANSLRAWVLCTLAIAWFALPCPEEPSVGSGSLA